MIIKKISVGYSIKKQLSRFEPIDVFMGAEAEIDSESEAVHQAQATLFEMVKAGAEDQITKIMNDINLESEAKQPF